MGVLIKGDPREERLYSMEEISQATGIKKNTLRARRKNLGIEATRRGYTYAQILQMARVQRKHSNSPNPQKIEELRGQLERDGML